jgi:WD40 repeat protein
MPSTSFPLLASLPLGASYAVSAPCLAEPGNAPQAAEEVSVAPRVLRLAFASDGKQLIAGGDTTRVFDVEAGKLVKKIPSIRDTRVLAVLPGREPAFVEAGDDAVIRIWRVSETAPIRELKGHTGLVRYLAASPDGKLLASSGGKEPDGTLIQGEFRLWNVATGAIVREIKIPDVELGCLAFSPDGKLLAIENNLLNRREASSVDIYELAGWKKVRSVTFKPGFARSVFFGPDGKLLIVGGDCPPVNNGCRPIGKLWRAGPGETQATDVEQDREYSYFIVCQAPAGDRLIVGTSVETATFNDKGKVNGARMAPLVQLRDARTDESLWSTMTPGAGDPDAIAMSPNGKLIAMALDQTIYFLDIETGEILREFVVKE